MGMGGSGSEVGKWRRKREKRLGCFLVLEAVLNTVGIPKNNCF
jgi:hypothetical protein